MSHKILISSCLIGKNCSYDAKARASHEVLSLYKKNECVDICPEIAGGLGCPRDKHEIVDGDGSDVIDGTAEVLTPQGKNHTYEFVSGAQKALAIAKSEKIDFAILKARSPSCGSNKIYSGKFDKKLKDGNGVTAELLKRNGIKVYTEEEVGMIKD